MLFRLAFYIFLGYLIYLLIKAGMVVWELYKAQKQVGQNNPVGRQIKKEKDISNIATIIEERRLDEDDP